MGMAWFAAAVGELVGAPIAGPLANVQTVYYMLAQAVPGAITILGAIFLLCPLMAMKRSEQNNSGAGNGRGTGAMSYRIAKLGEGRLKDLD